MITDGNLFVLDINCCILSVMCNLAYCVYIFTSDPRADINQTKKKGKKKVEVTQITYLTVSV